MQKSTHSGTCQVCGRLQALPAGVIAKHGYTVEHHFFNGICPATARAPLELERAFADEVAASLLVDAADADRALANVLAGKLLPKYASAGFDARDRTGRRIEVEVPFADATPRHQAEAVRALAANLDSRARMARSMSAGITARADAITGKQALQPREETSRREIVAGMSVKIAGSVYKVEAIEERVARGCGPFLNGNSMPHAIFRGANGNTFAQPVRLIRQAAIVD